jgi:glycosyltransferase involved in cell wall biosynthesis
VTCHGVDPEHTPRWFLRILRVLPVTVVACGEGPQRQLRSFGVRAHLVDNALEVTSTRYTRAALNEHFGLPADAVVALWPARYSDQKGHDRLLEAVAAADEPRLVVICVGDGPLKNATEARRDALGLTSKVLVLDPLEEASSWLAATDLFIVPSRWEGQPLVVLEALAAGLPVASCCPVGLEGLIADGVNGTLVETPAELGRVLAQWVRDSSSRPVNPAFSAEVLARHQPSVTAVTLETLYGREN